MIISTIQKTSISSTLVVKKYADPPLLELTVGKENFMIGFAIQTLDFEIMFDLNNGPQIFDIITQEWIFEKGN